VSFLYVIRHNRKREDDKGREKKIKECKGAVSKKAEHMVCPAF
jgi:hypothetical protein